MKRSNPLLVLTGFVAAQFPQAPLLLPATVLAVGALAVVSYLRTSERHAGATTESAAALAPLLGALVATDRVTLASALAVLERYRAEQAKNRAAALTRFLPQFPALLREEAGQ